MRPVTIVIPVHNAAEELRACLDALARNTTYPARLLLLDDASTDPAIRNVLKDAAGLTEVSALRNSENRGFSATVNRGIRAAAADDVVVLNSDTAVTPRWLERLVATAYRDPLVATVTPLSDNAGAFSAPAIGARNDVPPVLGYDDTGRLIAQRSGLLRPRTPTGNGFCMYVKRAALDELGWFDARAFPRGYGEENDFCMRALGRGWHHLVDDSVFVHHVREASFGTSKQQLIEEGRAIVDERHPQYTALVGEFVRSVEMDSARTAVAEAYGDVQRAYQSGRAADEVRPRLLFVIHEGSGGTPATNFDLMSALEPEYDCWMLSSTTSELWLDRIVGSRRIEVERHRLERPVQAGEFSRKDYRDAVIGMLDRHAIELVHVRHLFKHTFDLPAVAAARGIPVVFSFHDYYFTCPTVHLLDDHLNYCAGVCTPGFGDCRIPTVALEGLPPLKHRFVHEWRAEVQRMLAGADAFVTTSPHTRDVHLRALPELATRPFELIEHGRDLHEEAVAVPPRPGGPIRIAVPGSLDVHKGAGLMRAMLEHDASGRLEFHLMGEVPVRYADIGKRHGPYERDRFAEQLAQTKPAMVGIFSIWAETYNHTLSEAWGAGVPVIATALGALGERLDRHGGGWVIDPANPADSVRKITAIADDPAEYERARRQATPRNVRTVAEMSSDYSALYRRVIDRRRRFVSRVPERGAHHRGHGVLRAELVLAGSEGARTDAAHVRLLHRLLHPAARPKLETTVRDGREFAEPAPGRDLVIVQWDSVPVDRIDALLARLGERGVPLVLDLDEDPFAGEDPRAPELERLLGAAAMVTVATPTIARRLAAQGVDSLLVPDAIDERLFFAGALTPSETSSAGGPLRILHAGPRNQARADWLEAALEPLRNEGGPAIELHAPGSFDSHRQPGDYPARVRWLRDHRYEFDIAVVPVGATAEARSRSDYAFLECAALGLPAVVSDLEPHAAIRDGETALKAGGDLDDWSTAIRRLAEDPQLRAQLAGAAFHYVREHRLVRDAGAPLLAGLFDLVSEGRRSGAEGAPKLELTPASG